MCFVHWRFHCTAKETQCAGHVKSLFPFEEIGSLKCSFADQNLWWLCFIDVNVWTLISIIQRWQFWFGRQGEPWWTQKLCRRRIGSIAQINAKRLTTISERLKLIEVVSKSRKLGAIRIKVKRHRKECLKMLIGALTEKRKDFLHRIVTVDSKWIHYVN